MYTYINIDESTYIIYRYIHVCMHKCMHIYTHICTCMYMYAYVYAYKYTYIHVIIIHTNISMYTYIHTSSHGDDAFKHDNPPKWEACGERYQASGHGWMKGTPILWRNRHNANNNRYHKLLVTQS